MKPQTLPPAPAFVLASAILSLSLALRLTASAETAPPIQVDAAKFPNLQAALDALPPSGGFVSIPPGTYEITTPLRVSTAETRIVGSGPSTHILNRNEEGLPAILVQSPTLDSDPKSQLWRVQLADLRVSGNSKSGDGLLAKNIQEIYLEGVSIDHNGANGIHLIDCFEDPRIADCILTYNGDCGLRIHNCHDIVVSACHFEENRDALFCGDSFNLCMTGNNLDDHLRHGVVIENTYGSVVSGNMIEECNGTAIILDRDCYGITLSSNVIAHHLEGGIDLRDAWGCTVSANTFTLTHRFGLRAGPNSGRLSITGNSFGNSWIGTADKRPAEGKTAMEIDEGGGVVIEGAHHLTITGNSFTGLSGHAIQGTAPGRGLIVTGNSLADCGRKLDRSAPWIDLPGFELSIVSPNLEDRGR